MERLRYTGKTGLNKTPVIKKNQAELCFCNFENTHPE